MTTLQGEEKVIAVDPLRERVALRGADGTTRSLPLVSFTAETREFCERMHERVCDKPVDVERLREQIALAASRGSDRPSLSAGA